MRALDPRVMDFLRSRSRDDDRIQELMGERRLEKESAAKQQAQQDFLGSLSRGAAQMGAIGGQTARSTFQPGQVDADTRAIDLQIAQEAKKPGIDSRVTDYLMSKKEQKVDPIRQGRLDLDREKFEFEKQKRAGLGRSTGSGASARTSATGKPKKLTEGQRKTIVQVGFAKPAMNRLRQLVNERNDPGFWGIVKDEALQALPQGLFARYRDPRLQEWQNEASSAVEGLLKAMTGAASTNFETTEYKSMFTPLPGETFEQQNAKIERLQRAISALEESAGLSPEETDARLKNAIGSGGTPSVSAQNITESGEDRVTLIAPDGSLKRLKRSTYDANKDDIEAKGYRLQ